MYVIRLESSQGIKVNFMLDKPARTERLTAGSERECSQGANEGFLDVCDSISFRYKYFLDNEVHRFECAGVYVLYQPASEKWIRKLIEETRILESE